MATLIIVVSIIVLVYLCLRFRQYLRERPEPNEDEKLADFAVEQITGEKGFSAKLKFTQWYGRIPTRDEKIKLRKETVDRFNRIRQDVTKEYKERRKYHENNHKQSKREYNHVNSSTNNLSDANDLLDPCNPINPLSPFSIWDNGTNDSDDSRHHGGSTDNNDYSPSDSGSSWDSGSGGDCGGSDD